MNNSYKELKMEYLQYSEIKNFVKQEIIEKLENLKDCNESFYASDLGWSLFESENIDGAYFYNNYNARNWLREHFDDLSEIIEELKFQFDAEYCNKILLDFFNHPDRFILVIVLEVSSYLMGKCKTIDKNWNYEITLSNELINTLISELKQV